MKYQFLFLVIALIALGIEPSKLSANQCTGDAVNCTPAQLCNGATEKANGKVIWATAPSLKRYVKSAKKLGIDCGVIEQVEACGSNVEICTISQLCDEATYEVKGKKAWSKGFIYQKHVELAKSFGLDCGVEKSGMSELITGASATSEETTVTKDITVLTTSSAWLKIKDKNDKTIFEKTTQKGEEILLPGDKGPYRIWGSMAGYVYLKTTGQVYGPVGEGTNIIRNFLADSNVIKRSLEKIALKTIKVQPAANEATQSLTNTPEAQPEVVTTEKGNCYENERSCDDDLLCLQATIRIDGYPIVWEDKEAFLRFVKEAKSRGLQCEVTKKCEIDNLSKCTDIDLCQKWHSSRWNVKEEVFSRGFFCENSAKAALPLDDSTFCDKFTSRGSMSGAELYWFPKEAEIEGKRRGITCGTEQRSRCSENPLFCSDTELCSLATIQLYNPTRTVWATNFNLRYVEIARIRGLSCEITVPKGIISSDTETSIIASIQKELNRIGCSIGVADGIISSETRKGLFSFTSKIEIQYNPELLKDENFLQKLRAYPQNTCTTQNSKKVVSTPKVNSASELTKENSGELERLEQERAQLEATLSAMQDLINKQKRAAEAPYRACRANCLLNNKAGGKGLAGIFSGMAECHASCNPLKWGGEVVPPSWEQNKKRLQTINCDIMRLSKNHISANCR